MRASWERLLPMQEEQLAAPVHAPWPTRMLPTFRAAWPPLFASLVREFLFVSLLRVLAGSIAAENTSRLTAMQSAESRINDRLTELDLAHRQQHQQAITEEIIEGTTGFETLIRPGRMR